VDLPELRGTHFSDRGPHFLMDLVLRGEGTKEDKKSAGEATPVRGGGQSKHKAQKKDKGPIYRKRPDKKNRKVLPRP